MKKFIVLALILLPLLTACKESLNITVNNELAIDRTNEMVEIDLGQINNKLNIHKDESFIIEDADGEEIPYQITYNQKVIFQATITAKGKTTFCIYKGTPQQFAIKTCGRIHPERMDDLAWENDLVGFRAYGPTLLQKGERAFGYDLFAKRGTSNPVLEEMYAKECDQKAWEKFRKLKKENLKAAQEWRKAFTYHSDHGYGMDCYTVGPTLGAGVAALTEEGKIIYPWCYESCEILDNGPLRFTARLNFAPMHYKDNEIVETRTITLDAGSHMNRTNVSYQGLKETAPIVSGIVLHQGSNTFEKDKGKGYITYLDPTSGPNQGQLYIGHVHTKPMKDTQVIYFSEEEMRSRNNARGYILAESTYIPETEFIYYWGFGWNRSDIKDFPTWNDYVKTFSEKIKSPLIISIN